MGRVLLAGTATLLFLLACVAMLGGGDRLAFVAAFAGFAALSGAFLARVNDHPKS